MQQLRDTCKTQNEAVGIRLLAGHSQPGFIGCLGLVRKTHQALRQGNPNAGIRLKIATELEECRAIQWIGDLITLLSVFESGGQVPP